MLRGTLNIGSLGRMMVRRPPPVKVRNMNTDTTNTVNTASCTGEDIAFKIYGTVIGIGATTGGVIGGTHGVQSVSGGSQRADAYSYWIPTENKIVNAIANGVAGATLGAATGTLAGIFSPVAAVVTPYALYTSFNS